MKLKVLIGLFSGLFALGAVNAQDMTDEATKARIMPVGSVNVAGASSAAAASAGPRSGADIYNKACVACHTAGVLGAPKLHVAADWQPRLDEKGFDTVWQNAINGIGGMPPKGTCMDCSDEEIKVAIEYMIEGI